MARLARQKRLKRELRQVDTDEAPKVYLGEWLVVLGVTAAALSRATGISESMLSLAAKGENKGGKTLSLLNVNRIALALEIPVSRLFEPPPSTEALATLGRFSPKELERLRRT